MHVIRFLKKKFLYVSVLQKRWVIIRKEYHAHFIYPKLLKCYYTLEKQQDSYKGEKTARGGVTGRTVEEIKCVGKLL